MGWVTEGGGAAGAVDGSEWTLRAPATSPPPHLEGALAYDPSTGGAYFNYNVLADTGSKVELTLAYTSYTLTVQ